MNASDFAQTAESFPQPYLDLPAYTATAFDLPSVLVPPEIIELDSFSTDSGEDAPAKKEEWPDYYVRLFDSDVRLPNLRYVENPLTDLLLVCLYR